MKKVIVLAFNLFLVVLICNAQYNNRTQSRASSTKTETNTKASDIVYKTSEVDVQPQFPGGDAAMNKWISEHIQYPKEAKEAGVDGRVRVQFVVSKMGTISKVKVIGSRHPALDKEAVRVVKSMPVWKPARVNGNPVNVTFVLPVTFKLPADARNAVRKNDRQVSVRDISDNVDDYKKKVVNEEVIILEEKKPVEDIVYSTAYVDQQPQFPGGETAMYKWISEHIQYPTLAKEEGVDGRVTVQFVVNKTGDISNVQVVRSRHPALDKEAIRVVKSMPVWNPGRNNGQPVKVTFVLPVSFKLPKVVSDADKVADGVKAQDELREGDRQVGVMDIYDGVDDLTKIVKEEVVVVEEKKPVEDIVYSTANVDQQPQFPGGGSAMYKWISEHIQYPPLAKEEGVDGRVTVQFVVTKTGSINNVQIFRSRHPALDKEAIRVVKSMPAWNPGRIGSMPVDVTFVLPVSFKLP